MSVKSGSGRKPVFSEQTGEAALDMLLKDDTDGAAHVARHMAAT